MRHSNIELLRIYAMFFIVWGHIWAAKIDSASAPFLAHLLVNSVGIGVVDIFILITGYFLIQRQEFTLVRFFKILFEVMFYNFIIVAVAVALGKAPGKDLVICLFPLAPTKFNAWFVSQYLALILIQPFISRFVPALTRTQYRALLCVLLLLTTVLVPGFPLGYLYSSSWKVSWFITLFLAGGYIRIYGIPQLHRWIYVSLFVAMSIVWTMSYFFGPAEIGYNSLLTFCVAVLLLCIALKFDIGSVRAVNWISSSTFAAYLIHQNFYMIKTFSWLIPTPMGTGFTAVLLSGLLYMSIFFMAMVLVDKVRIAIFKACHIDQFEGWLSDRLISLFRSIIGFGKPLSIRR